MKSFAFEKFEVFGWVIHKKFLAKHDKFVVKVEVDTIPAQSGNVTLWTKGIIRGLRLDGYSPPIRKPGTFSLDFAKYNWGEYTFQALEDSEWWCINWALNQRQLPELKPFRLDQYHRVDIPEGSMLLICAGSITSDLGTFTEGCAIKLSKSLQVQANEPTYGLFFDREKS